jgi:hypothetical protein
MQDTTGISKLADVRNPILNPARDTMRVAPQFPNPFPVSEAGQDTAQGLMNLVNRVIESDVVQGGIKRERQGEEALNELTGSPVPGATLFAIVNMAAEVAGGGKTAKQLAKEAARKAASPNVGVDDLQSIAAQAEKYDANVTRGAQAQAAGQPLPAQDPSLSVGRTAEFDTDADIAALINEPVGGRRSTDVTEADILPFGGRPNPKLSTADRKRLALLDEKFPGVKPLLKYLTPNEARALNGRNVQQFLDTFGELDPSEMASVALAGQAKRGWYKKSSKALVDLFGEEDSMRFAGLLAAMSPQTSVESNLRNALNMWLNWDRAGRPNDPESILRIMGESVEGTGGIDSVLPAWQQNGIDALSAPDVTSLQLSGAKVDSFMQNIWGNFSEVTNDAWIAKYTGMNQSKFETSRSTNAAGESIPGKKTGMYSGINAATRKAAELLTRRTGEVWTPAEIQETVWSWSKSITEKANSSQTPITDLIADLTHSEVSDVPDFGTLLSQPGEFRTILEGGGFDARQLDSLAAGNSGAAISSPGQASSGVGIQPRHLDAAAQRLEAARRTERRPKAIEDLRSGVDRYIAGETSPTYRRRDSGDLRGHVASTYSLPAPRVRSLNQLGFSTPAVTELRLGNKQAAARYHRQISAAAESHPAGAQVYVYSPEEYASMRLFTTEDGKAGFALKGDDIVSVFNHNKSNHQSITAELMTLAIEQGGRKLDAFDTYLPHLYETLGFQEVRRSPWNEKYKPQTWDKEYFRKYNNGEPDVVYMEYRPTKKLLDEIGKKQDPLQGRLANDLSQPLSPAGPNSVPNEIDLSRFDERLRKTLN